MVHLQTHLHEGYNLKHLLRHIHSVQIQRMWQKKWKNIGIKVALGFSSVIRDITGAIGED